MKGLGRTLRGLPQHRSLFAYLISSMSYRDALNGIYTFGGIYAAGVLEWSVVDTGIFGIIAIISGAIFAWLGGRIDMRFGPKPVITFSIVLLALTTLFITQISRDRVLFLAVDAASSLPDMAYYVVGVIVGALGGVLQSASRTMMVRQANPDRMTEAFGLYALAGKATSFLAPLAIGFTTAMTGSQQWGVAPLVALFAIGLILLIWVKPDPKSGR